MSQRVLSLFARTPVPGQVKTRLSPPLTPEQASEFYTAMLLDILDQHSTFENRALVLWYTPESGADWFQRHAPKRYALRAQQGPNLGQRMAHLFRAHAAEGFERIVLRGTDSPTLPPARVDEAFRALADADLVLVPDRDGGYSLIGLRADSPFPALGALETSHASVFEETLHAARSAGLRTARLEPHHDVDTARDLETLRRELFGPPRFLAPRTERWLRAFPATAPARGRGDSMRP